MRIDRKYRAVKFGFLQEAQQLEHLLKFIVANGSFSGYVSEVSLNMEQKAASIKKQTMGQLVGRYLESTNPKYQELSDEPEELKEAFISFKFHTECDSIYYETKKDALAQMVSDRNELVHHMLPKFNTNSIESCIQINKKLDEQNKKIIRGSLTVWIDESMVEQWHHPEKSGYRGSPMTYSDVAIQP